MVQRKIFPASGGYSIAVASEEMAGGKWAAVATVTHSTETAQRTIDLPVSQERFSTESEAERAAVDQAREWIERNAEPETAARPDG